MPAKHNFGAKNEELDHIFQTVQKMKHNQTSALVKKIKLNHLLPNNRQAFYRYEGSLTTPSKVNANNEAKTGCHEIVLWTVFKEPIEISQEQFRSDMLFGAYGKDVVLNMTKLIREYMLEQVCT